MSGFAVEVVAPIAFGLFCAFVVGAIVYVRHHAGAIVPPSHELERWTRGVRRGARDARLLDDAAERRGQPRRFTPRG